MSEIDYIIKSANDQSLIVVDELARGTSLNEAQAICIATLEHFMVTKSTCFFVTHFFGLLELETYYPCMAKYLYNFVHISMIFFKELINILFKVGTL